jgi:hypothetical protein
VGLLYAAPPALRQSETRNPELGTRNSELGTRNW